MSLAEIQHYVGNFNVNLLWCYSCQYELSIFKLSEKAYDTSL